MKECLENNGCVFVRSWQTCEHYIIITKIRKNKVYIFDPYFFVKNEYNKDKHVKRVLNKPFSHNRIVTLDRLFIENNKDFSLGKIEGRECVLINKTNNK